MKTIHKYLLPAIGDLGSVRLPQGAEILKVGFQGPGDHACIWVKVDDSARFTERWFYIAGTGWNLDEVGNGWVSVLEHIDTVQHGSMVWHFFEVKDREMGPAYALTAVGGGANL